MPGELEWLPMLGGVVRTLGDSVARFAVTPGLRLRFSGQQLSVLGESVGADGSVELTTVQQLIVTMDAERAPAAQAAIAGAGMQVYAVGAVVKNVRVCGFCQGDVEEGFDTAQRLDRIFSGRSVPFTLRVGYTGCPNGCSEPLLQDIGVVKVGEGFDLYAGGHSQGTSPRAGVLVAAGLSEAELIARIEGILDRYVELGRPRERFWRFVDRVGAGPT